MKPANRLLLDVALFSAIVIAYAPLLTGISVHEWLGLGIAVPALLHMLVNWEWVVRAAGKLVGRLSAVPRINLAVDAALFVAAVAATLSGLLVSQVIAPALGLNVVATALWLSVHSFSADATVLLLIAHFALHAKWMATAFQSVLEHLDSTPATTANSPRADRAA